MNIFIKRKEDIEDKVNVTSLHGKFPYKIYLEIKGNNKYGQYIMIVSNKDLHGKEPISSVCVEIKGVNKKKRTNNGIVKPNSINGENSIYYNVREVNFIDVQNESMFVFTNVDNKTQAIKEALLNK